ncbi:MAG: gliding motility-associated C-terminal domain-containing protein, partial [Bacteroidia bacterium]|nr:gliding motility-associated C-terminal domain-containing protein [Bacteroidia bacterium]
LKLVYKEKIQCDNKKEYEIQVKDTSMISLPQGPNIQICQSQSPLVLQAIPSGGQWLGNYVNGNSFDAYAAAGKTTQVSYEYTNANTCISHSTASIYVEKLPELTVEKSREKICVGDLLLLNALTSSSDPGYWYTDGAGSFDQSASRMTNYTPSLSDVSKPFLTFIYTLQTNGVCGNVPVETIAIIRNGQQGEIIKNYPLTLCEPANLNFTTNFQRLEKQFWLVNDSIYEEFDYNFPFNPTLAAGEYVIKSLVYDSACQAMAISETITVLPKPTMNLYSNPGFKMSREYPRLYLKDLSYCKFGHTVSWYLNNMWIGDSREMNIKIDEPKDTFEIKMIAISGKGDCMDSLSQQFVFIPINQLYIPNAFSPDSKGPTENNSFKVVGPPMRYFKIEIFNKYGEKVYMSEDMNASWDGLYKGQVCMQGDYFYKIETTDNEGVSRDYSGTVSVIR